MQRKMILFAIPIPIQLAGEFKITLHKCGIGQLVHTSIHPYPLQPIQTSSRLLSTPTLLTQHLTPSQNLHQQRFLVPNQMRRLI
jgi:hypothetical protein